MAIGTKTNTIGNYTVEISYGTAQEVVDRLTTLLKDRLWNINFFIEGYTIDAQGVYSVLLKYITTPS